MTAIDLTQLHHIKEVRRRGEQVRVGRKSPMWKT